MFFSSSMPKGFEKIKNIVKVKDTAADEVYLIYCTQNLCLTIDGENKVAIGHFIIPICGDVSLRRRIVDGKICSI